MKENIDWVKSSIGMIGFLKTEKNMKESESMIPEGTRVMHIWELTKLKHTEESALNGFDLTNYFMIETKNGCRAGFLLNFYDGSGINFSNRNVKGNCGRLRGVCLVKEEVKQ